MDMENESQSFDEWFAETAIFAIGSNEHYWAKRAWDVAAKQEREACANIAISWSDKSFEAEQIAAEIQARNA